MNSYANKVCLLLCMLSLGILTSCSESSSTAGCGTPSGNQPVNPPPNTLWMPVGGVIPASGNYVYLESEVGDYIGQGATYTLTDSNAVITLNNPESNRIGIIVNSSDNWMGDFETMSNLTCIQPGYYANLERWPFHNIAIDGFSWTGAGRACNASTGWVVVENVTYSDTTLTGIEMRFEQYCGSSQIAALHGKLRYGF